MFVDDRRILHVAGTRAAESIIAEVVEGTITIEIRTGEAKPRSATFPLDAFDVLEISAGNGADFVNIIDPAEALDAAKKALKLDGGEGDNIVVITHLPFQPEIGVRLRALSEISTQLTELAQRASDAATAALVSDTMRYVERVRAGVIDEAQALAADADRQLHAPATELFEKTAPRVAEQSTAIFARVSELAAQHEKLVAEMMKIAGPAGGEVRPDDMSEPPPGVEPEGAEPDPEEKIPAEGLARAEELAKAADALGADARARMEKSGAQIEGVAAAIAERGEAISQRADRFSESAEELAGDGERELTASSERVLAIVRELQTLAEKIDLATPLRDETMRSISMVAAPAPADDPAPLAAAVVPSFCTKPIVATNFYTGGNNSDFFLAPAAPAGSWSISGGNGFNVLAGGTAADDIRGGANTDWIFGYGGNDQIHGGDGTDFLFGEWLWDIVSVTGDDCIWGEKGLDTMAGDNLIGSFGGDAGGNDWLFGDAGTDLIVGDDLTDATSTFLPGGVDNIEGNDGDDLIFGCGGRDILAGDKDIDFIIGNGGHDEIRGHGGRVFQIFGTSIEIGNLLIGSSDRDRIFGGDGVDLMFGNEDIDEMWGGLQLDVMYGNSGGDIMRGEAGGVIFTIKGIPVRLGNLMFGNDDVDQMWGGGDLDVMFGQLHDDRMFGFDGNLQIMGIEMDIMFGGQGVDSMEGDNEMPGLINSTDIMFGGLDGDIMRGGSASDMMFGQDGQDDMRGDSNAPWLIPSNDLMFGGPIGDSMDGGNGSDVMFGEGGRDIMLGDNETVIVSSDLIFGNGDNDDINGGSASDVIFAGNGDDNVLGDSNQIWQPMSKDLIFGEAGADKINGGNGIDLIFGQEGCDHILGDNSTPGAVSSDMIFAGPDDDYVDGGVDTDLVWGNDGHDTILGDIGAWWMINSMDLLWGDEGCDTIRGGSLADFIWGGPGVDQLHGERGPDLIWGNENGDTISGGDWFDLLWGNEGNDLIHGDAEPDWLWGDDGDDCLYGDDGRDVAFGGSGDDCVRGGGHVDVLSGGDGNDRIFGDSGNDVCFGNDGDDKLDGGSGADLLSGLAGSDEAWGGPGIDLMFAETKHQSGSSGLDCECKTETCTGTLCVRKFNDLDGNGMQGGGEAGLPNWTFQVTCGCTTTSLTTAEKGAACATFFAGNCTVVETMQPGWTATTPATQTVTLNPPGADVTFGNRREGGRGELCVRKFHDENRNGVLDTGEVPLSGWVFQINGGSAGTLTTSSTGTACSGFPVGAYTITEVGQTGWIPTTPPTQSATVAPGQATTVQFGNTKGAAN